MASDHHENSHDQMTETIISIMSNDVLNKINRIDTITDEKNPYDPYISKQILIE
jgi:hypothetical protein